MCAYTKIYFKGYKLVYYTYTVLYKLELRIFCKNDGYKFISYLIFGYTKCQVSAIWQFGNQCFMEKN